MGKSNEEFTEIIIYVDDGIIFSNRKQTLDDILHHLESVFEIRSLPADRFLGIDITRDRPCHKICISQSNYITKIIERFGMSNCNQLAISSDPSFKLSPETCPKTKEIEDELENFPYKEAVGCLMYAMLMTRPDIAYAVGQVA